MTSSPTREPRTFLNLEARDPDSDPAPSQARATNYAILQTHVALKGAQAGALIGPLAVLLRYRSKATTPLFLSGTVRWTAYTALGALAVGIARVWSAQPVEIYDRAYRLNNNLSQNRVDRISLFSAAIGSAASLVVLPRALPLGLVTRVLAGACTGLAGGVGVHVISSALWDAEKEKQEAGVGVGLGTGPGVGVGMVGEGKKPV